MKIRLLPSLLAVWLLALRVSAQLALSDTQTIIAQAVTRATTIAPNAVIAVVDREGWVLGVWSVNGSAPSSDIIAQAIGKAGTASFLSSDQHAFTSRTAGYIVQQHFPPGVLNTPPGPLVGVNFSNLGFSDINKIKGPGSVIVESSTPGTAIVPVPVPVTGGLVGTPGGVPLFLNGHLVGGVGVAKPGDNAATDIQVNQVYDIDEDIALAGQTGYAPADVYLGSHVLINGIRVAYVNSATTLGAVLPFGSSGVVVAPYSVIAAPAPHVYPTVILGGLTNEIRQPITSDPIAGTILGQSRLTATEVTNILALAANRARTTRAGIRLPRGQQAQVFITVVNNPYSNGVAPTVLGTIRTPGATMFSWDVAVQKARTAVFFSATNYAYSSRAVGFLAQSLFPPGISSTEPGLFIGMQERFSLFPAPFPASPAAPITNPLNGVVATNNPVLDPNLPNGITIFPGGFPLYRNGVLIGAIGVSGDGIDQDDLISASGCANFLAPFAIRSDQYFYRNARLPYAKFPRNPAL